MTIEAHEILLCDTCGHANDVTDRVVTVEKLIKVLDKYYQINQCNCHEPRAFYCYHCLVKKELGILKEVKS